MLYDSMFKVLRPSVLVFRLEALGLLKLHLCAATRESGRVAGRGVTGYL